MIKSWFPFKGWGVQKATIFMATVELISYKREKVLARLSSVHINIKSKANRMTTTKSEISHFSSFPCVATAVETWDTLWRRKQAVTCICGLTGQFRRKMKWNKLQKKCKSLHTAFDWMLCKRRFACLSSWKLYSIILHCILTEAHSCTPVEWRH